MRVENAADHRALLSVVARWHWDEWGHGDPSGSFETWTTGLGFRANRDRVPMTLIAFDDISDAPIGSVTIVDHDMPDRIDLLHLTPWIAGTFVVPNERLRGVGSALMQGAAEEATRIGLFELFLYTSSARPFYERLEWNVLRDDTYEGESVTIMTRRFANPS